ncbi:type I methionyl aminopeptidase [Gemmatimonadota bacterium Y43]|uniref:type I methionyl aminopeptidase n=1 Tax=Gaopeijia maritima TaxID=3119007 RepID=UPI003286C2BE
MSIESHDDLVGLAAAGALAGRVREALLEAAVPGITPRELDARGAKMIERAGGRPAPPLQAGFPAATCISVNEVIAHGVPDDRALRSGDLLNVDVSVELAGYWADTGASITVGAADPDRDALCATGRRALDAALGAVRAGGRLNALGRAAEAVARADGRETLRDLCGHGVGRALWEEPSEVVGYHDPRDRRRLHEGLVLAVEPFVTTGARHTAVDDDGWGLRCDDGGLAVQYEHTFVVTAKGAWVVTAPRPFLVPWRRA